MFEDFMTMDILSTFAGLTTAVIIIVQFTKSIIKKKWGSSYVRVYAFIISLLLTFIFARKGNQASGIILTIINAMMITIASLGGYEMIVDPMALKKWLNGGLIMKHAAFMQYGDGSKLEEKVENWIMENEAIILEIVDIEYTEEDNMYYATITYMD